MPFFLRQEFLSCLAPARVDDEHRFVVKNRIRLRIGTLNKRQKEDLNSGIQQINDEKAALRSCFRASEVRDSVINGQKSPNIGVTGFGFSIFNKLIGVLLLLPIIFRVQTLTTTRTS